MDMARLTKRILDAVKPDPNKEVFVWCSATPGFGARVYPSGRTVFITQVRVGRAQRRVKIGPYGAFTVDQARERAEKVIRTAAAGNDPQGERRDRREALTVAELCDLYLEAAKSGRVLTRFGQPKKNSTLINDSGRINRHIKPLIGTLIARDLSAADVQRMADAIADGKTAVVAKGERKGGRAVVTGGAVTATRVTDLLGGIWTWAVKREHVPARSITRGVDKAKARPKDRTLNAEELGRLGSAISSASQSAPAAVAALHLIALTGARREEIVRLRWAEVDILGSCLHLGDTKTGRSTRAIGAPAMKMLRDLQAQAIRSEYVFPGARRDGPADLKKAIAKIFDVAGLSDVRSHDLRRTFASVGDEIGLSEPTIASLLGHAKRSVTAKHYIRRPDAAMIAAATSVSERIERCLFQVGASVLTLNRANP
jgi:integrase